MLVIFILASLVIAYSESASHHSKCDIKHSPTGVENRNGAIFLKCKKTCINGDGSDVECNEVYTDSCSHYDKQWVGNAYNSREQYKNLCCKSPGVWRNSTTTTKRLKVGERLHGSGKHGEYEHEVITNIKYVQKDEYDVNFTKIHCPPPPPPGPGGAGCFTELAQVLTPNGLVEMGQLKVGDSVLTEQVDVLSFSPIRYFLHREPQTTATFIRLRTHYGKSQSLTPGHVIYRVSCSQKDLKHKKQEIFARDAKIGDCLLTTVDGSLRQDPVVSMDEIRMEGIYAPVTDQGSIIVDGVLASCFNQLTEGTLYRTALHYMNKVWAILDTHDEQASFIPLKPSVQFLLNHLESVVPNSLLL